MLGMGQSAAASFYTLAAKAVVAHRRAKQRQKTMSGSTALPPPVWLREPSCNRHVGSYKLSRLREADELKASSDPGLARVRSLRQRLHEATCLALTFVVAIRPPAHHAGTCARSACPSYCAVECWPRTRAPLQRCPAP